MLVEKSSIDFKFDFLRLAAILVHFHSNSELMAVMSEIERDRKSFSKALGLPTHLRLTVNVQRDLATSHVMLDRDRCSSTL